MPRLPDATALGESPSPQPSMGVVQVQGADQGAIGRAMVDAGSELQKAAGIISVTNARQDEMVAEAAINQMHAQRVEMAAGEQGFGRVSGAATVGPQFVDAYEKRFTEASTAIVGSLQNDNQRRIFQQRVPVVALQFRSALLGHQARETDKFNDQTENATIDLARREMFAAPMDPNAQDAGLARINWAIDQKAQRQGWSPEVTADTKAKFQEKVYEDMASILVERDPAGSLAALDKRLGIGGPAQATGVQAFDSATDPSKLITLRARAASYVEQARHRTEAEQKRILKEAESTYNEVLKFAMDGQMVSPDYERQIISKVVGTPFEPQAKALIAASFAGGMHGSQPLPQQEAGLRQLDAAIAAKGTSAEEAKLISHIRTITQNQKAAYNENPWSAATRFGRQVDVPEVSITSPGQVAQLVAQRMQLIGGIEVYAGRAVSPLQPGEAKAFAEQLRALPPDARAETLGQTGVMLNAPRVAALADQLDKHDKPLALSLKMGADRTTAGRTASALVLRGAQALQDKTVKRDESALAGWRAEIATLVRGTLGDERAEQDVIDAAYFIRAAQDQDGSAAPGFKSMSGADDAVAMVIGKPIERSGVKTLLPRGMDERTFDSKLRTYTPERLREIAPSGEVYVRGQPIKIEQLSNRLTQYGLRRDGQGRYVPSVNNAPVTLDPQGTNLLRLDVR